jgi:hypothetical protein
MVRIFRTLLIGSVVASTLLFVAPSTSEARGWARSVPSARYFGYSRPSYRSYTVPNYRPYYRAYPYGYRNAYPGLGLYSTWPGPYTYGYSYYGGGLGLGPFWFGAY